MFDVGFVAHCFGLKESHLANFVYEAIETTLSTARRWGNIAAARTAGADAKLDAGAAFFSQIIGNEALSTSEGQQSMVNMLQMAKDGEKKSLYSASGGAVQFGPGWTAPDFSA